MQKERNNKTRNIILTIFGILIFCVIGTLAVIRDSNDVSQYMVKDNITINNSGMYYGGEKAFTKTADVVVCKGTNILDDQIKRFNCNMVIESTDSVSTTTTKLNQTLSQTGKNIFIEDGYYYVNSIIDLGNGNNIVGAGIDKTVFISTTNNQMFNVQGNLSISHMSINGNASTGHILVHHTANYVYIDHMKFFNLGSKAFWSGNEGLTKGGYITNSEFYNYYSADDCIAMTATDRLTIFNNYFYRNNTGSLLTSNSWYNTEIYGNTFYMDNFQGTKYPEVRNKIINDKRQDTRRFNENIKRIESRLK